MATLNEYAADTRALYWYLTASPQLGANALAAFREGEQGRAVIYVSSITLAELYYLNVKLGSPLVFSQTLTRLKNAAQFVLVDFRADDTLLFDALTAIPEMHDRIIAGVALARNCPCLTRDRLIVGSGLVGVAW